MMTFFLLLCFFSIIDPASVAATATATETVLAKSSSTLEILVSLSRHGARAPNADVLPLCPNLETTLTSYSVPLQQLTPRGMNQLEALGQYVRRSYVPQLLPRDLNRKNEASFPVYFRSDAEPRCAQSAVATGYGLYPTGPDDHVSYQPLSVVQELLSNEVTFAATKNKCKWKLEEDTRVYDTTRGQALLQAHETLMKDVYKICGLNNMTRFNVLDLKDVTDAFMFNEMEGLTPPRGWNERIRDEMRQLQFQMLMERYYTTKESVTYWCGGFPALLLENIDTAVRETQEHNNIQYYSYHGHRELLYALGRMVGWPFSFQNEPQVWNQTAIPPGTTMFFEIHSRDVDTNTDTKSYFVRMYHWSPAQGKQDFIKLPRCSDVDCPLSEFRQIFHDHLTLTGTWQEICHVPQLELDHQNSGLWSSLSHCCNLLLLILLGIGWYKYSKLEQHSVAYQKL